MKTCVALLLFSLFSLCAAFGQLNVPIHYQLLGESTITDECQICGRPTIPEPLRGSFNMILREQDPIATRYEITNVHFVSGTNYVLTGFGTYEISGQVAVEQRIELNLQMWRAAYPSNVSFTFTNADVTPLKTFPIIGIQVEQTTPNLVQFYSMNLVAAPMATVWFSTSRDVDNGPRAGDLVALGGTTVISNRHIDAFHARTNGEYFYSTSLGLEEVQEGDLLKQDGTVYLSNQELTSNFGIQPIVPDLGLDALFFKEGDEIWFSIRTNEFSEGLGAELQRGDILSNKGQIVANNLQLLGRFNPAIRQSDFGLDAIFQWPHGEIWFSTEDDFLDNQLGQIRGGDLLSDQGYIVYRNFDLITTGAPDADYGLDAVHVLIDSGVELPRASMDSPALSGADLILSWSGVGTGFQVLKSSLADGPYSPISPLTPQSSFRDSGALTNSSQGFYLLRQW